MNLPPLVRLGRAYLLAISGGTVAFWAAIPVAGALSRPSGNHLFGLHGGLPPGQLVVDAALLGFAILCSVIGVSVVAMPFFLLARAVGYLAGFCGPLFYGVAGAVCGALLGGLQTVPGGIESGPPIWPDVAAFLVIHAVAGGFGGWLFGIADRPPRAPEPRLFRASKP